MDKLTFKNESRLLKAVELIDKIVTVGKSALEKYPTGNCELLVFTFINYLERFTHNLEAINILLREYKNKPNVETSIGLIIRASLLDFMTITYLSTFQADISSRDDKESEAKFKKQFDGLMTDQIHNTIKYLKLIRDVGSLENDEYEVAINNIWHIYSFLFTDKIVEYENPEKKLISREHKSPKQYFTRIQNHPLTKKFSMVYDLYTYYSKYEHFGIMTHFLQRQGFDNDLDMIITSMKYITRGVGASMSYLSYPVDKLKIEREAIDELQNNFDKL